jgi:hypothetical protein
LISILPSEEPRSPNLARDAELLAVAIIETWLDGKGTVRHTGNTHDLDFRIRYQDGREAVGEVGVAVDPQREAMWHAINRMPRPQVIELPEGSGQWSASLRSDAKIRDLEVGLPKVIAELRRSGVPGVEIIDGWVHGPIALAVDGLGVARLWQLSSDSPDVVVFFPPSMGGVIPPDGDGVVPWIEDFLSLERNADYLAKLERSGAAEQHLVILVAEQADFGTLTVVGRDERWLPSLPPCLPVHLSHLWLVPRYSQSSEHSTWLFQRHCGWSVVRFESPFGSPTAP